jgi:cytochrome c oxidase subunit 1
MVIFSNTLHRLGLMGMPRRTMIGAAAYVQPEWKPLLPLVGLGGVVLTVSALLYFANIALTLVASRTAYPDGVAFAEAMSGADHAPGDLRPVAAMARAGRRCSSCWRTGRRW